MFSFFDWNLKKEGSKTICRLHHSSITMKRLKLQEDFRDYYKLLGLYDESDDDLAGMGFVEDPTKYPLTRLNRAYRKLALAWHPDKNPTDVSGRFQTLQDAMEVFRSTEDKAAYDESWRNRREKRRREAALKRESKAMRDELNERERLGGRTQKELDEAKRRVKITRLKEDWANVAEEEEEEERREREEAAKKRGPKTYTLDEHLRREREIIGKIVQNSAA